MFSNVDNDTINKLIKNNSELEAVIQGIIDDNKKVTSQLVHEVRNPLALIKGTIQYIEAKHPEVKGFKYWDQLQDLVIDMENVMNDASMYNTCNNLHKDNSNLLELIHSIGNYYSPEANSRQIELIIASTPKCEPYFSCYNCDQAKLKQVLSNIIKNSLEATPSGGYIHIDLDILPEQPDTPAKLLIRISNNGLPIPEDEIGRIFMPFVSFKKGGTGIGLALSKKIIDLHYGNISVTSDEAATSFTILLPVD